MFRIRTIKPFCGLVWLLWALLAQSVLANPELTLAQAFNLKAINGQLIQSSLFGQSRKLNLNPGLNLLAVEYEEVFDSDNNDDFDLVKSDIFLIEIYLEANSRYLQRYLKPQNAEAAKSYAKFPLFEIIKAGDSSTAQVRFEFKPLASNQDSFLQSATRVRPNATLDLSHPQENSTQQPVKKQLADKNSSYPMGQSQARQMLEYWWQQATPEERAQFIRSKSQ